MDIMLRTFISLKFIWIVIILVGSIIDMKYHWYEVSSIRGIVDRSQYRWSLNDFGTSQYSYCEIWWLVWTLYLTLGLGRPTVFFRKHWVKNGYNKSFQLDSLITKLFSISFQGSTLKKNLLKKKYEVWL